MAKFRIYIRYTMKLIPSKLCTKVLSTALWNEYGIGASSIRECCLKPHPPRYKGGFVKLSKFLKGEVFNIGQKTFLRQSFMNWFTKMNHLEIYGKIENVLMLLVMHSALHELRKHYRRDRKKAYKYIVSKSFVWDWNFSQ